VDTTCAALRESGLELLPADVCVENRDDRWLVRLPRGRTLAEDLAWVRGALARL
jgi:hypothetical protein